MPSNRQRFVAVVASAVITVGGAWLASMATAPAVSAAPKASAASLSVALEDVRNDQGKVIVLIFDDWAAYAAFDFAQAAGYREVDAAGGRLQMDFPDLDAGPYAVFAFHDENGNQDLDMDGQIPLEGYSVSGDGALYDEPTFDQAAVPAGRISMRMLY